MKSRPARQTWTQRFRCAFVGLAHVLWHEPSGRVHAAAVVLVTALGAVLNLTSLEWALLSLCCGSVIGAEALNTAIERLADRVSTEQEEAIRIIKDTAAAGVLACTLGAAGVALCIFLPKLL